MSRARAHDKGGLLENTFWSVLFVGRSEKLYRRPCSRHSSTTNTRTHKYRHMQAHAHNDIGNPRFVEKIVYRTFSGIHTPYDRRLCAVHVFVSVHVRVKPDGIATIERYGCACVCLWVCLCFCVSVCMCVLPLRAMYFGSQYYSEQKRELRKWKKKQWLLLLLLPLRSLIRRVDGRCTIYFGHWGGNENEREGAGGQKLSLQEDWWASLIQTHAAQWISLTHVHFNGWYSDIHQAKNERKERPKSLCSEHHATDNIRIKAWTICGSLWDDQAHFEMNSSVSSMQKHRFQSHYAQKSPINFDQSFDSWFHQGFQLPAFSLTVTGYWVAWHCTMQYVVSFAHIWCLNLHWSLRWQLIAFWFFFWEHG